jgi:hypothetical protein
MDNGRVERRSRKHVSSQTQGVNFGLGTTATRGEICLIRRAGKLHALPTATVRLRRLS